MKMPGNMQAMMKQAQQMQEKMQAEVAAIRVEGSAGGGIRDGNLQEHRGGTEGGGSNRGFAQQRSGDTCPANRGGNRKGQNLGFVGRNTRQDHASQRMQQAEHTGKTELLTEHIPAPGLRGGESGGVDRGHNVAVGHAGAAQRDLVHAGYPGDKERAAAAGTRASGASTYIGSAGNGRRRP